MLLWLFVEGPGGLGSGLDKCMAPVAGEKIGMDGKEKPCGSWLIFSPATLRASNILHLKGFLSTGIGPLLPADKKPLRFWLFDAGIHAFIETRPWRRAFSFMRRSDGGW